MITLQTHIVPEAAWEIRIKVLIDLAEVALAGQVYRGAVESDTWGEARENALARIPSCPYMPPSNFSLGPNRQAEELCRSQIHIPLSGFVRLRVA